MRIIALVFLLCTSEISWAAEEDNNIVIETDEIVLVEKLIRTDHAVLIKMYIARLRLYFDLENQLETVKNENDELRAMLFQAREEIEKNLGEPVRGEK